MSSKFHRDFDNWVAMIHDLASGADVWSSRPSWIEFATNNRCNLRCVMCSQPGDPAMAMAPEDARTLLEALLPDATVLTPSSNSEPLLADIELVLEQCRKHDVYLDLYTNATLLTPERFAAIAERLYRLHLSFDSHIPAFYERLRAGASFAKVVENLRAAVAGANARGIPVVFIMVMMADNTAVLADYVDFVADLGATQIRVQALEDQSDAYASLDVRRAHPDVEIGAWLDQALERARDRKVILTVEADPPLQRHVAPIPPVIRGIGPDLLERFLETVRRRYPHFCSMASSYLKVTPDGTVYPCCHAPAELNMGNVHEQSLSAIWNGPAYRQFRRRMHARQYGPTCASCPVLVREHEAGAASIPR
jgi:radical SAM protein with 4Fe4S-binding SPASM domain